MRLKHIFLVTIVESVAALFDAAQTVGYGSDVTMKTCTVLCVILRNVIDNPTSFQFQMHRIKLVST